MEAGSGYGVLEENVSTLRRRFTGVASACSRSERSACERENETTGVGAHVARDRLHREYRLLHATHVLERGDGEVAGLHLRVGAVPTYSLSEGSTRYAERPQIWQTERMNACRSLSLIGELW